MSNLLKSVYFNVDKEDAFVIQTEPVQKEDKEKSISEQLPEDFTFIPGMNVLDVEQVVHEEKERIRKGYSEYIEKAQVEAASILENAKQEAERIREEAKEAGRKEGYEEGILAGQEECRQLEAELAGKQEAFERQCEDYIRSMEPKFASLIAGLVERLIGVEMEDHVDVILYLIRHTLENMPTSHKYTIHVSKEDSYRVESQKEEWQQVLHGDYELEIVEENNLKTNQCLIEMDHQVVDCSLQVQLERLKEELRILSLTEDSL